LLTVILPVVAPAGTVAWIRVADCTVKVAGTPLKLTAEVVFRLVPVSVTTVPTGPAPGLKPLMVGGCCTVKLAVEVTLPAGLVTVTGPVVTPTGATAVMLFPETTVKVAGVPLKLTAVVLLRLLPLKVTTVPATPEAGLRLPRVGGKITVKEVPLVPVPTRLVTLMVPEGVPVATVAVIRVSELTV